MTYKTALDLIFPGAAVTKHQGLGDLNNRNLFSHIPGGPESEVKLLAAALALRRLSGRVLPASSSSGGSGAPCLVAASL